MINKQPLLPGPDPLVEYITRVAWAPEVSRWTPRVLRSIALGFVSYLESHQANIGMDHDLSRTLSTVTTVTTVTTVKTCKIRL